jgi:predicted Zn-dependent protease
MDEQEVRELFFERLEHLSADAEYELRHPDYVMEMPQSGERIRGRDNMRAFQDAYPNPPTITTEHFTLQTARAVANAESGGGVPTAGADE